MIELTFGEGAAGALKSAKSIRQEDRLIRAGLNIESRVEDVEALTLVLDIGDISDMDTHMLARKKLLDELFAFFPGVSDQIWKTNQHALTRLQEAQATPEPVRMWICASNPAELCGLYFVCRFMGQARTPLSVVRVPEQIRKDNCIVSYKNIGEINPESFSAFIEYERCLSELERIVYADFWNSLMDENAPLRAVINGSLIGAPQDFYDFALRANMPDGEFMVAQLIGKTLGEIPGVVDWWLFLRIQAMLQSGELISVSAATEDHPYSGVVKRSN